MRLSGNLCKPAVPRTTCKHLTYQTYTLKGSEKDESKDLAYHSNESWVKQKGLDSMQSFTYVTIIFILSGLTELLQRGIVELLLEDSFILISMKLAGRKQPAFREK